MQFFVICYLWTDILIRTNSYTSVSSEKILKKLRTETPVHNCKQKFRTAFIAFYAGYCNSHCVLQYCFIYSLILEGWGGCGQTVAYKLTVDGDDAINNET